MTKKNILLKVLKEIEERDGLVSPKALVAKAKSIDSPLHGLFDWNDGSAAAKYRLYQARNIIREVTVDWQGKETKAYWGTTITIEDMSVQGYFSTEQVVSDARVRNAVLKDAIRELKYWDKKYKEIKELRPVINRRALRKAEATV